MTEPDPLRATDLPPVPPTAMPSVPIGEPTQAMSRPPQADLGGTAVPRHAINPDDPIPVDDPITLGMVSDHVVDVDERLTVVSKRMDSVHVAGMVAALIAVISLAISIYLIIVTHGQGNRIDNLSAQLTTSDNARARIEGVQSGAICRAVAALRGTRSTASRDAWTSGPAAYDRFYASLSASVQGLNCGGG